MPGLPPVEVPGCDPACEHEWGEELPGFHPGQVPQTKWKNVDAVAKGGNAGSGAYCQKCGGWRGCLGLEPDVLAYVGHLVLVCRALRRVLRDDGTFWLNLGDSYFAHNGTRGNKTPAPDNKWPGVFEYSHKTESTNLKSKDLIGVPDRVRFALQADGWYVRSAIVWAKGLSFLDDYAGSVMPESVRDRPTSAYEMVYLLAKEARYFYDAEAVKEAATMLPHAPGNTHAAVRLSSSNGHVEQPDRIWGGTTRNLRNVWAINPAAFPGAHYAVFPPALVAPMIEAGTSEQGVCAACGAPWERVVERIKNPIRDMEQQRRDYAARTGRIDGHVPGPSGAVDSTKTTGFRPTCTCEAAAVPATVLDPFAGSATTCTEARRLGRRSIGIDLGFDEDVLKHRIEHAHHRTNGQLHVTPSALGTQPEADLGPLFSAP